MIEVEAHATQCRMAIIIILLTWQKEIRPLEQYRRGSNRHLKNYGKGVARLKYRLLSIEMESAVDSIVNTEQGSAASRGRKMCSGSKRCASKRGVAESCGRSRASHSCTYNRCPRLCVGSPPEFLLATRN